jgi:hypothetical protein
MPAGSVSEEISHLMRDKGYPHRQAIAAALNMERRGTIRANARTKRAGRRSTRRVSRRRAGRRRAR